MVDLEEILERITRPVPCDHIHCREHAVSLVDVHNGNTQNLCEKHASQHYPNRRFSLDSKDQLDLKALIAEVTALREENMRLREHKDQLIQHAAMLWVDTGYALPEKFEDITRKAVEDLVRLRRIRAGFPFSGEE